MKFGDDIRIVCSPVEENVSTWVPEGKNGHLRLEGTFVEFDAPLNPNGDGSTAMNIITDEKEKRALEKAMEPGRPEGWLNPFSKDNRWTGINRFKVRVGVEKKYFDMTNPYHYIQVKILEANRSRVAPSFLQRTDKRYDFYIDDVDNINREANSKFSNKMRAMEVISDIKDSRKKMESALLVIYRGDRKVIGNDTSLEGLRRLLYEYADNYSKKFLEFIDDPDYTYLVYFYRGVDKGAIIKSGIEYRLGNGDGTLLGKGKASALNYIKELEGDIENQARWEQFRKTIK